MGSSAASSVGAGAMSWSSSIVSMRRSGQQSDLDHMPVLRWIYVKPSDKAGRASPADGEDPNLLVVLGTGEAILVSSTPPV